MIKNEFCAVAWIVSCEALDWQSRHLRRIYPCFSLVEINFLRRKLANHLFGRQPHDTSSFLPWFFFFTLFGNWFSSLSILNLTLNEISPFLPPCLLILKWIWSGCLRNSLEALAALSYSAAPSFRNRQINHFDNETRGITQAFFDNIEFSPHNRLLSVELCHFVAPATLWRCQKKPRNFNTKKKFNQNQQTVVQGRSVYF